MYFHSTFQDPSLKISLFFFILFFFFFRNHPFLDPSSGDFPFSSEDFFSSSKDFSSYEDSHSSGDFFLLLVILLLLKIFLLLQTSFFPGDHSFSKGFTGAFKKHKVLFLKKKKISTFYKNLIKRISSFMHPRA